MKEYDLVIVGAGASGLMAGILAKERGLNFLIIEKNSRVGMKLGITGKGRCNITNYTTDLRELISKYTHNGKFLYHAFSKFGVQNTYDFFEDKLNIPLKVERGKRVFPKSENALDVVNTFYNELRGNILLDTSVNDIKEGFEVLTSNGTFLAKKVLLATGGTTYPSTGSTGDGYTFAQRLGHTINQTDPVLLGFKTKESFVKGLAGLTLKFVTVSTIKNNKKKHESFGELLFTHNGVSGPTILNLSQYTYGMYGSGFEIEIDLKPKVSLEELDSRVNTLLRSEGRRQLKSCLAELMPKSLIPVILSMAELNGSDFSSEITKEQRLKLVNLIKGMRLTVVDHEGLNRAVVNTGGVEIKEIDPKTMESKLVPNLFFSGDIIDVFGPTGGFNLQIAWSTSYLAISENN